VPNLNPNQTVTLTVRAIGTSACANSGWFLGASGTSDNPDGNAVFVPNAFTPNSDGVNDILYAYGNTIATMQLRIFNQWGQLVFESKERTRGWDGTMSGEKQPVGVYTYELKVALQDGSQVIKRGTITLIR
jgi:gliding motility-associated-like protein